MTGDASAPSTSPADRHDPGRAPPTAPRHRRRPLALHCLTPASTRSSCAASTPPATGASSGSADPQPPQDGPADRRQLALTRRRPTARAPSRSPPPVTTRAAGGTITGAEYFLDTAGANGTGTPMTRTAPAPWSSETATIPAADVQALGEGDAPRARAQPQLPGLWGPPLDHRPRRRPHRPRTSTPPRVGPNPTNGVLSSKAYPGYLVVSAEITDRDAGGALAEHRRRRRGLPRPDDGTPRLSATASSSSPSTARSTPRRSRSTASSRCPRSRRMTDGQHHVYVHGKDAAGNWGSLTADNALVRLFVDKTAPVLGALTGNAEPDERRGHADPDGAGHRGRAPDLRRSALPGRRVLDRHDRPGRRQGHAGPGDRQRHRRHGARSR